MKIHILSDLHLESAPFDFEPTDADFCILAGDISSEREEVVELIGKIEKHYPVVFVPGNHEYYPESHEDYGEPIEDVDKWYARALGHAFFQMNVRTISGLRIAGCTLWTDFFNRRADVMRRAESVMPDFSMILAETNAIFTPTLAADLHVRMRDFLSGSNADIVVTHHAPSRQSIGPEFMTSDLNGCFVNDMEDVIIKTGAKLWIHGHTHDAQDYLVNECRIICNPRGYQGLGYMEATGFDPLATVEV